MSGGDPRESRRSGRAVVVALFALAGIGLVALAVRVYGGG